MNCFYSFPVALVSLQFPVFSLTAQMKHCNSTVSECNSTHCRTNGVQDSWSTSNQLWQADEFEIQAHCQAKQYCRMSARSSNPAMGKKKVRKRSHRTNVCWSSSGIDGDFLFDIRQLRDKQLGLCFTVLQMCLCVWLLCTGCANENEQQSGCFPKSVKSVWCTFLTTLKEKKRTLFELHGRIGWSSAFRENE